MSDGTPSTGRRDSTNYPRKDTGKRRSSHASDDTDYRSRTSTSKTKKSSKKRKESSVDVQTVLWFLILFEVIILLALVCAFYALATRRIMIMPRQWNLQKIPGIGSFQEMAVSSSSEHCSEIARTLYLEGVRTSLIASALKFCLDIQQPDRSGKYGSSVVVHYSPETGCEYTGGQSEMSTNKTIIDRFIQEVLAESFLEARGPYSELIPFDVITTLALLRNASYDEIKEVAGLLYMEHGDRLIALTINSVDGLEVGFLVKDPILFDQEEELSRRTRGEVVLIPNFKYRLETEYLRMIELKENHRINTKKLRQYMDSLLEKGEKTSFTHDKMKLEQMLSSPVWFGSETFKSNGRQYCYPLEPSIASIMFKLLEHEEYRLGTEGTDADRAYPAMWHILRKLYDRVFRIDGLPDVWNAFYQIEDDEKRIRPMAGNFFTLAFTGEAYAFVGTLGSRFGSLSSTLYMNNLAHNFAYKFNYSKGYSNTVYPFISLANDSIDVIYSGSPGYPTLSIGIPRLLFTLLMHHHFNMKYEEAVAYPLVYPSIKGPFIHNGYPFSEILAKQIVYPVGEVPRHFGDSAAIISVRHDGPNNTEMFHPFYKNKKMSGRQFNSRVIGI